MTSVAAHLEEEVRDVELAMDVVVRVDMGRRVASELNEAIDRGGSPPGCDPPGDSARRPEKGPSRKTHAQPSDP